MSPRPLSKNSLNASYPIAFSSYILSSRLNMSFSVVSTRVDRSPFFLKIGIFPSDLASIGLMRPHPLVLGTTK